MYPNYPNQGYPPQSGAYPPQATAYPQQPVLSYPQAGFVQQQPGVYPPMVGGYPQQIPVGVVYPQQGAFPNQTYGVQPQMSFQPHQQMMAMRGRPTITPTPNFDASNDAAALKKAMKGIGCDKNALINVLCRRTRFERFEIIKAYRTAYGKDLMEEVKSETSGNFGKVCVNLLKPIGQYYAETLFKAMEGRGTDEATLIEILCGLTNAEAQAVAECYKNLYGKSLEDAIKSETSHCFKNVLMSLLTGNRDESMMINIQSAQQDAQALKSAGVDKWGTDESEFNRILCLRNNAQIRLIAQEYEKLTGHTLEKDIKKEFSGDVEKMMLSIVRCAVNSGAFFAERIHKAVAGLGTDDASLMRLIITRSDVDMLDIKEEYPKKFKESLKDAIKGDTSGNYRDALFALIGETK